MFGNMTDQQKALAARVAAAATRRLEMLSGGQTTPENLMTADEALAKTKDMVSQIAAAANQKLHGERMNNNG